jgi:hypothetical protein
VSVDRHPPQIRDEEGLAVQLYIRLQNRPIEPFRSAPLGRTFAVGLERDVDRQGAGDRAAIESAKPVGNGEQDRAGTFNRVTAAILVGRSATTYIRK